jgi:hypothetical protein
MTITVDGACPDPVALIKIDVAGNEAAVVAGAAATIQRDFPATVFAHAPSCWRDPAQDPFGQLLTPATSFTESPASAAG